MPVIKSSKKRMRQTLKRRERNYPLRSMVKTYFKKELKLIRDKDLDGAVKFMPEVYSIIDTACKKKLLQPNTASRKKSRLARA
ncbi:MAG: 30S ribosomal protein S20, partial [Candidatus Peregrinibacteria bacterium]